MLRCDKVEDSDKLNNLHAYNYPPNFPWSKSMFHLYTIIYVENEQIKVLENHVFRLESDLPVFYGMPACKYFTWKVCEHDHITNFIEKVSMIT